MKHRLSFVIATRDENPEVVDATIHGLLATSHGYWREVIVVDDASSTRVTFSHPDVVVLRNPSRIGSGLSRRRGSAAAGGDVIVGMDAHMSFAPGWLEAMLPHVDSGDLLCPPWRDYRHSQVYMQGAAMHWQRERDYANLTHPGIGYSPREPPHETGVIEVQMVLGACYMMQRKSYERLGGWNPLFSIYGSEEQDLSARTWMAGLKVRCVTEARVGHLDRDETNKTPFSIEWNYFEHNQAVIIRSLFERQTSVLLEDYFLPLPRAVEASLAACDLEGWRDRVQALRKMSDAEFLNRFIGDHPLDFSSGEPRLKDGERPAAIYYRHAVAEESRLWTERTTLAVRAPDPTTSTIVLRDAHRHESFSGIAWTSLSRDAFGITVGMRSNRPEALRLLSDALAESWPAATNSTDVVFSLLVEGDRCRVFVNQLEIPEIVRLTDVTDFVAASLRIELSENAKGLVFVDAGVVAHRGRAIVLLGNRLSGRAALVAELVRQGATYYSHALAVLDEHARVLPFAQALQFLRPYGEAPQRWETHELECGREPLPLGLVVEAKLEPGAQWRPRDLTHNQTFLRLFGNAVNARDPECNAFGVLRRATDAVTGLRGKRGDDTRAVAAAILAHVDATIDVAEHIDSQQTG